MLDLCYAIEKPKHQMWPLRCHCERVGCSNFLDVAALHEDNTGRHPHSGFGYAPVLSKEIGAGEARWCYPCCDDWRRAQLAKAHAEGKLSEHYLEGDKVTTWSGSFIAQVIRSRMVPTGRLSYTHGKTIRSVRVRDVNGNEWVGRSNDGIAIKLRAVKGKSK